MTKMKNKIDRFEPNRVRRNVFDYIHRNVFENSRLNVSSTRFNRFPEFSRTLYRNGWEKYEIFGSARSHFAQVKLSVPEFRLYYKAVFIKKKKNPKSPQNTL